MTDFDERVPDGYEVRYGFDRRTVLLLTFCALFTVLLVVSPSGSGMGLAVRVAGLVLFGGGGLLMLVNAFSGRVAFRVDAGGVLLGGTPLRYEAQTDFVPWADVEAVVLWRQRAGRATVPWVGLARRPDAPPLRGGGQGQISEMIVSALMRGRVPAQVVMAGRACAGWRPDTGELARAVGRFAPGVPVLGGH